MNLRIRFDIFFEKRLFFRFFVKFGGTSSIVNK